jgi:NagD protein
MTLLMSLPTHLYEAYIFDLDGTVYLGDEFLPTARETLERLRALGKRTVFLSNNPTHTRQEYSERLTRMGLPTPVEDIVNSSIVMVDFLLRRMPGARLFVAGEEPLKDELAQAGFRMTEQANEVEAVIASFDRTFSYHKLQVGFDALRRGARFYATNADPYCPVPGGGQPDAAAIIAAYEACTGRKLEAMVGKPSEFMAEAILGLVKLPPERCIITGDRLETDVQMGLNVGMDAALTLTGATSEAALADSRVRPTYVLGGLADLIRIPIL